MIQRSLALLSLVTLLTACGGGGGGSAGSGSDSGGSPGAGGGLSDLAKAGTGWKTGCRQQMGSQGTSMTKVSGNTLVMTFFTFADGSNCATGDSATRLTFTATTAGTSSAVADATNLNLTPIKAEMMVISSGAASDFNIGSECGKTDWVNNGQWVDVTSTNCWTLHYNYSIWTIFKISNGNSLAYGKTVGGADGRSEGNRHATLDPDYPQTKF